MNIAITAKAKHGYIYRYMQEQGISASALGREIGIHPTAIGKIINFKWVPGPRSGGVIAKLEEYFKIPIDQLFPPEFTAPLAEKLQKQYVKYAEVDLVYLGQLPDVEYIGYDGGLDEQFTSVEKSMALLSERERGVIELRFGLSGESPATMVDVGERLGISPERVRQIEAKALRLLQRHATRIRKEER